MGLTGSGGLVPVLFRAPEILVQEASQLQLTFGETRKARAAQIEMLNQRPNRFPEWLAFVGAACLFVSLGILGVASDRGRISEDKVPLMERRAYKRGRIHDELGRMGSRYLQSFAASRMGDMSYLGSTSWGENVATFLLEEEGVLVLVWKGSDGVVGSRDDISRVVYLNEDALSKAVK